MICPVLAYSQEAVFVKEEKQLLQNVASAERRFGPDSPKMLDSLSCLAALYRTNGRTDEDSIIHGRQLSTYLSTQPILHGPLPGGPVLRIGFPGDRSESMRPKSLLSHWLNRKTLPKFYAKKQIECGQYQKAFQSALATAEKEGQSTAIARNLIGLADVYCAEARFNQAELVYERALAVQDSSKGFSATDYGNLIKNLKSLAMVYRLEGKGERAKQLEQRLNLLRHTN